MYICSWLICGSAGFDWWIDDVVFIGVNLIVLSISYLLLLVYELWDVGWLKRNCVDLWWKRIFFFELRGLWLHGNAIAVVNLRNEQEWFFFEFVFGEVCVSVVCNVVLIMVVVLLCRDDGENLNCFVIVLECLRWKLRFLMVDEVFLFVTFWGVLNMLSRSCDGLLIRFRNCKIKREVLHMIVMMWMLLLICVTFGMLWRLDGAQLLRPLTISSLHLFVFSAVFWIFCFRCRAASVRRWLLMTSLWHDLLMIHSTCYLQLLMRLNEAS